MLYRQYILASVAQTVDKILSYDFHSCVAIDVLLRVLKRKLIFGHPKILNLKHNKNYIWWNLRHHKFYYTSNPVPCLFMYCWLCLILNSDKLCSLLKVQNRFWELSGYIVYYLSILLWTHINYLIKILGKKEAKKLSI